MTLGQARSILLAYRPGHPEDAADPEISEALRQVQADAESSRWLAGHRAAQQALQEKFRGIPVPPALKEQILAGPVIIRPPVAWWRSTPFLAAAAAVILLGFLAVTFLGPHSSERFVDYRESVVQTVLRQYRMETRSNDDTAVRRFMASKGAPADYVVPPGLQRINLIGGGVLQWHAHPVSMVCFDAGANDLVWLFVIKRSALEDTPPAAQEFAQVIKLETISWTAGDNVYMIAARDQVHKYF